MNPVIYRVFYIPGGCSRRISLPHQRRINCILLEGTQVPESIKFPLGFVSIFALRNFKLAKMAKRKNPISWVSGKSSRFFSKSWKNHGEKCSPCFFVRCSIKKISGIPKHADDLASRSPFLGTTGELREASEAKWWYLFIWKILKCSGNSNGNFYIHTPSIENSVNF